ncbi:HTH-type transcriptional regulator/antitoxin HigA [Nocardioides albertanoniae]|jgi:HTH-type transcriptional regulator/antitoxin HigA|uniref:HTH-type transcriptional regulator/antitoxin HigA n=1 Tax=Nocardioides albertanoniae TaxID=1175486 RepID=A0A543A8K1_9ACTN|nr:ImmA/IrrE family metallo-endopeptidase [Nocardioides albertanoniae]TQL68917.1 HTH-type transcriptional regulator/antitoxin HigA [Nocardioides albertanoniae]
MSNTTHDPLPIDQTPVGELLDLELTARGWSQVDFAAVLGRPTQFVSEIVTGKKEITRESAAQIGAALSQSPEYWLRLQDQYLLAKQERNVKTQAKLDEVRRRARLNRLGPIQLLQKRGFLKGVTLDDLEPQVQDLYELTSLDDEPRCEIAAKRANQGEAITLLQRAWVFCVRREARRKPPVDKYSPARLAELAAALPRTIQTPEDFATLPEQLADVGVRLVYVEALPGAKIDGCAMWVGKYPVIGLSGRGKRFDKVLFALLHEIAHVLHGHVANDQVIVENLDDKHESAQEKEANDSGRNWIFPDGYPSIPARISGPWAEEKAAELGIAYIVLIGQLQKKGQLDWRTTLVKGAPSVADILPTWN